VKGLAGRLVLLVTSATAALAIAEFVLSRSPDTVEPIVSIHNYFQFNVLYGIEPKPNLVWDGFGFPIRTNSEATYGPEIRRDGTPIIMHLGDSYSVGIGVAYENNYPYLVQEMVNARSLSKYQTIILGIGGSSPVQQEIIFRKKLTNLRPSLVVYQLYDNDIVDDYVFRYSQYRAKMEVYEWIPRWLRGSAIAQKLYVFFSERKTKEYADTYEATKNAIDPGVVWETLMRPALEKIRSRAERLGAAFLCFYIPNGWEIANEYAAKEATPLNPLHRLAKKWATDNNVPYVDLYEPFVAVNTTQLNELYLDGTRGFHLNERGTKIAADHIYELIETHQLLKK